MTNIANNVAAKLFGAFVAVAMVVSLATPAQAATIAELEAMIASLTAQLAALTGGSSSSAACTFTRSLTDGVSGSDVTCLQNYLIGAGFSIPAGATGYFGSQTTAAVAAWQAANGVSPAVGYFGPVSQAKYAMVAGSSSTGSTGSTGDSSSSSELSGGAGSVDTYKLTSGFTNEEVGEDEDDVEIAGLEIENGDGSDIRVTALKLVFAKGTAGSDFDKYADDVTVWFKGEKVGEKDADDFTDDNSYTQTISFDEDVVIDADEKTDIIVAVSGISNLDSADATDTWTVDFRQIRFVDAQGAVISEDPNTGTVTFSFETFATASDVELKITSGDEDINDAHIFAVDATQATNNVPVFSFEFEVEGDSDIRVDDFSIEATVTGAAQLDEMVDNIELYMDGVKVDSMAPPTDEETVLFDDLDLDLEAGETYEFEVRVDFLAISGALDEGDTLSWTIGETETDLATTDIKDANGDALADADITGSATSEASATFSTYIDFELVSADAEVLADGNGGSDDDIVTFTMVFDLTAVGGTVYVGDTAAGTTVADGSVGIPVTDAIVYRVYDSGTATTDDLADLVTFTTPANVTDSTDNIKIEEGGTSRVTLTVTQTNDTAEDDGIYYLDLAGVAWGIADDTVYEYVYTYGLDEVETRTVTAN